MKKRAYSLGLRKFLSSHGNFSFSPLLTLIQLLNDFIVINEKLCTEVEVNNNGIYIAPRQLSTTIYLHLGE